MLHKAEISQKGAFQDHDLQINFVPCPRIPAVLLSIVVAVHGQTYQEAQVLEDSQLGSQMQKYEPSK